jgi:ADP-heptose:LPS heptosyltransferase
VSKIIDISGGRVIISRTDSIGDVLLTLPICAALKRDFPNTQIIFLASAYTIPVIQHCTAIDEIVNATELFDSPTVNQIAKLREINADAIVHVFPNKILANLAKKAKIPHRIGTSHRTYHLLTCNHRINFTRKKSNDHEAQLNFHLLEPFGYTELPTWDELNANLTYFHAKEISLTKELLSERKKVILHAKSQGSAVEWPIDKYNILAKKLVDAGYTVYFTGTEKEGIEIRKNVQFSENIMDTTGKFTLDELISFVNMSNLLVACSTGPLHIAGTLNKPCIGLFTPKKPMHPGRWRPLGENSSTITAHELCKCANKKKCSCLADISVDSVLNKILEKLEH